MEREFWWKSVVREAIVVAEPPVLIKMQPGGLTVARGVR